MNSTSLNRLCKNFLPVIVYIRIQVAKVIRVRMDHRWYFLIQPLKIRYKALFLLPVFIFRLPSPRTENSVVFSFFTIQLKYRRARRLVGSLRWACKSRGFVGRPLKAAYNGDVIYWSGWWDGGLLRHPIDIASSLSLPVTSSSISLYRKLLTLVAQLKIEIVRISEFIGLKKTSVWDDSLSAFFRLVDTIFLHPDNLISRYSARSAREFWPMASRTNLYRPTRLKWPFREEVSRTGSSYWCSAHHSSYDWTRFNLNLNCCHQNNWLPVEIRFNMVLEIAECNCFTFTIGYLPKRSLTFSWHLIFSNALRSYTFSFAPMTKSIEQTMSSFIRQENRFLLNRICLLL